jgi:hypothetical protein
MTDIISVLLNKLDPSPANGFAQYRRAASGMIFGDLPAGLLYGL